MYCVARATTIVALLCTRAISTSASQQGWPPRPQTKAVLGIRGGGNARDDRPYSFSLTTFSPRGSLSQIEHAMNSAQAGALSAAVTYEGGIVVATVCKPESSLVMDVGTRKIAWVADGVAVLYSGLAADSRVLTSKAMDIALGYRGKFGEQAVVPVGTLVSQIAMVMQEYTQMGGVRPFGVALLVAGIDLDGPVLYRLEPSGCYSAWKCIAIGKGSVEAEAMLHEGFEESMDRTRALELVLRVLQRCSRGTRREEIETAFIEEGTMGPLQ